MPFIEAWKHAGKIVADHHSGVSMGAELHPHGHSGEDISGQGHYGGSANGSTISSKPAPSRNLASEARSAAQSHNYGAGRQAVLQAAKEGRATYLPAGSRNNATARILIDGEDVGEASTLGHLVHEEIHYTPSRGQYGGNYGNSGMGSTKFGERRLLPGER